VVVLLLSLMPAPLAGEAQGKVYRIGWLSPASSATGAAQFEALRKGLAELGYFEGRNIAIEGRWADGDATRLPRLARALVELRVDIICSFGTPATLAAKRATTTIPIVFGQAAFPEQSGIVTSLAQPGGNLTGIAFIGPEYGKRLELLREEPRASDQAGRRQEESERNRRRHQDRAAFGPGGSSPETRPATAASEAAGSGSIYATP